MTDTRLAIDTVLAPDGRWCATVRDVPVAAYGDTKEEASANAALLAVEVMMRFGQAKEAP